jgi:hypothetical protein
MQKTIHEIQTSHCLINGDARDLSFVNDQSVHLIITSPPYWNLKRYNDGPSQMGHIKDYEDFLNELTKVWQEVYRILVPGGRATFAFRGRKTEGIWLCRYMPIFRCFAGKSVLTI